MTSRASRGSRVARTMRRSRARRYRQPISTKSRIKNAFALAFLGIEVLAAVLLVAFFSFFLRFSADLPNLEALTSDVKPSAATTVWSQDGVMLGQLLVENRQPVSFDKMPAEIRNATIAIEDHRFYDHPGVDLQGIVRAAWVNMRGNTLRQGASTLTQQLVRTMNIYGVSREKNFIRKAREILIAIRLEQFYSKKEILQLYLNNVYYGAGAYGIEAASKTYFGKSAAKLTQSEAALLAGLPQRPRSYTPFEHSRAALIRRDEVLDALQKWGYITPEQMEKSKEEKLHLMPPPKHQDLDFKAPYFARYVLKEITRHYGVDFVYSGIRIDTTLNWKMQQAAEEVLKKGLALQASQGANQGALVSIDPLTGYIRAMVGGRDFHNAQYNAVTQGKRQPGSTFKVFDYVAAFDTGALTLQDGFIDRPVPYPHDPKHRVVMDYGGTTSGEWRSCKTAIQFSLNTIAIQVAQKVGIKKVIEYAHRMGITSELAPYLPTALGASAVHPVDLCSAYTIFPNGGNRCLPMSVTRITNAGGDIIDPESFAPQLQPNVLKPSTVSQIDEALTAVVESGTGTAARGTQENGIVENARGKTGTTNDSRDAWFAGYTPELTTVIWVASVAYVKGHPVYRGMENATGGHVCAPIWHDFMVKAVPEQRKFRQVYSPSQAKPAIVKTEPKSDRESGAPHARHKKHDDANVDPNTGDASAMEGDQPGIDDSGSGGTSSHANSPDGQATPAQDSGNGAQQATPNPNAPDAGQAQPGHETAPTANPDETSGNELRTSEPSAKSLTSPAPKPVAKASHSSEGDMVAVKVCVDSGDLINGPWCKDFVARRVTRSQLARMHHCRLHHAPSGE